jgi:hypothetical protein
MVSHLGWTIGDASWTGLGFRVYLLPQIPIREALGEPAPTLMPWQKPKNPSKLLLNILNIPLLKLNLGLSPNLAFLGFHLATKRHHLRRWKYQCGLAFRVAPWKLQEKSSMVPIIFTSIPNFNPCCWAFDNEIPIASLLCKAISIPGDQGEAKFKVSKVQKNSHSCCTQILS